MKKKLTCVLLIDDDILVNFSNKVLIDNEGCCDNIIKRESAIAGLYYLTKSADVGNPFPFPDLILLDIDMPEISGFDFMDYFEKIKKTLPSLPIIYMLTAHSSGKYISQGNNIQDVEGVYKKPLTHEILQTVFEKHFMCI